MYVFVTGTFIPGMDVRELDELKFANHQMSIFCLSEFIAHIPSEMTFLFLLQTLPQFKVFMAEKKVR